MLWVLVLILRSMSAMGLALSLIMFLAAPPEIRWNLSLLPSGEMRDTAQLGPLSSYMTNALMPLEDRARLFRTWASLLAMMPSGGEKVTLDPREEKFRPIVHSAE